MGGLPLSHKPRERSSRPLLQIPTMAMNVATHVSLLLVVGLMIAPYQPGILALRSCLSWRAVVRAGVASLVVAMPPIQRFPFAFEFALTAARLFVAMMVLGGLSWWRRLLWGFFVTLACGCFTPGRRWSVPRDGLNAFSWALESKAPPVGRVIGVGGGKHIACPRLWSSRRQRRGCRRRRQSQLFPFVRPCALEDCCCSFERFEAFGLIPCRAFGVPVSYVMSFVTVPGLVLRCRGGGGPGGGSGL